MLVLSCSNDFGFCYFGAKIRLSEQISKYYLRLFPEADQTTPPPPARLAACYRRDARTQEGKAAPPLDYAAEGVVWTEMEGDGGVLAKKGVFVHSS